MHLISLQELDGAAIGPLLSKDPPPSSAPGLVVLLDFLPLGPDEIALRAAVARVGASLVSGAQLFPGFPESTDLLQAVRAVGAYGDAIVLRHPQKGAARAAAALSPAPVLSAGDGAGEDPLFALADLSALSDRLDGLVRKSVALCGDLRHNRRVHSLAFGLLAVGARALLVPAQGAEPEEGFLDRLAGSRGHHAVRFEARSMTSLLDMVDSWFLTPDLDHQLSLFSDLVTTSDSERRAVGRQAKEVAALWMAAARDARGEPLLDTSDRPLPWREADGREVVSHARPGDRKLDDWELDPGSRAPAVTRALAAVLAGALGADRGSLSLPDDAYVAAEGIRCQEPDCIACREPSRVTPAFRLVRTDPFILSCVYCWRRRKATHVASRLEKRFHKLNSAQVKKILPRNTVFFGSGEEAEAAGFVSSKI